MHLEDKGKRKNKAFCVWKNCCLVAMTTSFFNRLSRLFRMLKCMARENTHCLCFPPLCPFHSCFSLLPLFTFFFSCTVCAHRHKLHTDTLFLQFVNIFKKCILTNCTRWNKILYTLNFVVFCPPASRNLNDGPKQSSAKLWTRRTF